MQVDRSGQRENVLVNDVILQFRRWKQHLFRLYVVLPICVGLVTLGFLLPSLIGAGYMMLGNQALETEETYVAVEYLQQARIWSPASPGVYRSLAQAYLLLDRPEQAVAALEDAYRLQPDSLLIQQELAQAYEAADAIEQAYTLWETVGVTVEQMVVTGDRYLDQRHYAEATAWYSRAMHRQPVLQSRLTFRKFLIAIWAKDPTALKWLELVRQTDTTFTVYSINDEVSIQGADLRWGVSLSDDVTYGTPLSHNNDSAGYFWWSGEALAVVWVERGGKYRLSMNVLHGEPAPIEMAIGVNDQQVQRVSLNRGDNSWETITTTVDFVPGLHTIHIWFLNDGVVRDKDRNAVVKWVEVKRQTEQFD